MRLVRLRVMRPAVWRPALALVAGLLLYAGHPPIDFAPAGLIALAPLVALAADCRRSPDVNARAAFGWGLVAGIAVFGPMLEWIGRFGFPAWLLLVLLQASFVGLFVMILAAWRRPGTLTVAVVLWAGLEAARARAPLGGFPWGQLGYSQHDGGLFLPAARIVGVLGVGVLCAAVGVALFGAWVAMQRAWRDGGMPAVGEQGVRDARNPLLALMAVLIAGVLLGVDPPAPTEQTIDIAAIQGNDLPATAAVGDRRVAEVAKRIAGLTRELTASGDLPDVVVWPENSLDDDVTTDRRLAAVIGPALRALDGTPLLAGMLTDGPRPGTFLNTIARLSAGPRVNRPQVDEIYVKRKVVPFGEYVPGRRFLEWIPALDQIPNDAVPGDGVHLFDVGDARIGAIICFENIFPGLTVDMVRAGANVMVVSTNNASYGYSAASRQHVAFSQLRAVESGRWVLHAGISGISAVVDPLGNTTQVTGVFERAIVRADVPLVEAMTPAMYVGPWLERVALFLGLLIALIVLVDALRDRRRRRQMATGPDAGYSAPQAPVI